jgi:radical SAM superfamily enzyme YgiQ (UPF0313 family)
LFQTNKIEVNENPKLNSFSSGEIVLVFPGKFKAPDPQVPLSLLHLASPLEKAGYTVRIIDMRMQDASNLSVGSPILVGISSMSGLQIRYGLEFAKKVRAENPSCPIVWGGIHPSLLPEQTLANPYVDIVVRGEGEATLTELATKLENNQSLNDVDGITFKLKDEIRSNPNRSLIDLDSIPIELPYHLLPISEYPAVKSGRFHVQTSRGCPNRCGFCYNSNFNHRKWRGKSPNRVLDEFKYILKKFPQTKIIDPIDDNFFVDQKRVELICQGMLDRGIKVAWRANCRFDYLCDYEKDFLRLLEKAGCKEMDFGGETGSERLQSFINKDITADQMLKSVDNLQKWAPSIEPYVSWMSGLPSETEEDLNKTFDLMDEMSRVNPKTQHYGIFVYTPFPSPVLDQLGSEFKAPISLEEWGKIDVFHFRPPWHSKAYVNKLHAVSATSRYAFYPQERIKERGAFFRLGYGILNKTSKYRWRHRYFGLPLELKMVNAAIRKFRGYL